LTTLTVTKYIMTSLQQECFKAYSAVINYAFQVIDNYTSMHIHIVV